MAYPITAIEVPTNMTLTKMNIVKNDGDFLARVERAIDLAASALLDENKAGNVPEKHKSIVSLAREVVNSESSKQTLAKKIICAGVSRGAFTYTTDVSEITDSAILQFIVLMLANIELVDQLKG